MMVSTGLTVVLLLGILRHFGINVIFAGLGASSHEWNTENIMFMTIEEKSDAKQIYSLTDNQALVRR
jgi:hypothetical protein